MALLPYRLSPVEGSPIIWGEKENLEFFLTGVTPVVGVGGLDKEVDVGGSRVSRYPGDPNPYNRKGGKRRIYLDKSTGSVGTPGRRFWMEFTNPDDESQNEVRQFTCVGPQGLLRSQIKQRAAKDFVFRSASGKTWDILVLVPPLADPA